MRMRFWVSGWGMAPETNILQAMPHPNIEPMATPMEAMSCWGM